MSQTIIFVAALSYVILLFAYNAQDDQEEGISPEEKARRQKENEIYSKIITIRHYFVAVVFTLILILFIIIDSMLIKRLKMFY